MAEGRSAAWLAALVPPAIWVHHYIGLRHVFGGSAWQTAWKGTLLLMVYTIVVFGVMIAIGLQSMKVSS